MWLPLLSDEAHIERDLASTDHNFRLKGANACADSTFVDWEPRFRTFRVAVAICVAASALSVASAAKPAPPAPETIVITEIMTNPSAVLDSRGEWFEVHNPGTADVDLQGWTITDEQSDRHEIGKLTVPAGGFIVLARVADPSRNGGVPATYEYGEDLVLLNNPDRLVLLRPDGSEADRVDWGTGFPWPRGRSMSLGSLASDNSVGANWCLSTTAMWGGDLGSPSSSNRCTESSVDLVFSEILQNPKSTSDSVGEWFELLNRGGTTVDLAGFSVKDDDGDRFAIEGSLMVGAGQRVVIGRSADTSANGAAPVSYAYGTAMALHNSSDELVLLDLDGVQVDRVAWDDGRTFPDPNGASMVLANPDGDNDSGSAWCTAKIWWAGADRGTPGGPGGCAEPGGTPQLVITEVLFDPVATGDRSGEWFEVANLGNEPVDLAGWTIRDFHDDSHMIGDLTIAPGRRAVLAETGLATNGGVDADYVYGSAFHLHNTVDELVLVTPNGVVVDQIRWGTKRGFPDPVGASIELVDPTSDNALGANWCTATQPYGSGDLGTPGESGACAAPGAVAPLVITEVMRNPSAVHDDDGEWFEVFNPSDSPVDLFGWTIADEDSDHHRIAQSVVVEPGGYALLGRSAERNRNGKVDVDYAYGVSVRLSNTADELVLSDPHGRPVDRIAWDDGTAWIRPNGASMALVNHTIDISISGPQAIGNEPSGWCESAPAFGNGDRGTPGAPTICLVTSTPDRIVITEVHRNPASVADSLGEWIELFNADDHPVNLNGWTLRDDDWDEWTLAHHGSLVIKPGEYLVVGKLADPSRNGGAPVEVSYRHEMILFNGADEITLVDRKNRVIDRVEWQANTFAGGSGFSAQLTSPTADGSDPGNWCDGVTPFGDGDLGSPGLPSTCG